MKVHTKVVIDMNSLEVIEDEFFEYKGPVALAKSGGAGGGSPSGTIAYPAYMQTAHGEWLNHTAADVMLYSITDLMNEAMTGPSPYSGFVTIDVDNAFLGPNKGVVNYIGPYDKLADFSCFDIEAKYAQYVSDDTLVIDAAIVAESALQNDEIDSKVLPRFQAGMLDINAVQSSAFVLGEALIHDAKDKILAKFSAQTRLDAISKSADISMRRMQIALEYHRLRISMSIELARIYATSRKDVDGLYAEIGAKDRLFDLSIYQYGVNVMSSIAGSAVSPPDTATRGNEAGALSGALMGAAIGAQVGGGWGAAGGFLIGGIAGSIYK